MLKCWIYHETEEAKIVNIDDAQAYYDDGWADSPARFLKLDAVGIDKDKVDSGDEEETAKAQQALDMVDGIKDSLNGALNIGTMNKNELEDYAKTHFNIDIDRRKSTKNLRRTVKAMSEA